MKEEERKGQGEEDTWLSRFAISMVSVAISRDILSSLCTAQERGQEGGREGEREGKRETREREREGEREGRETRERGTAS